MQNEIETLNRQWIKGLYDLQVKNHPSKELNGGILCPACQRMHGRNIDAIYPFVYAYAQTKESCYLKAAQDLYDWSENLSCPDGSWLNDIYIFWKGISVFNAITLMKTAVDFKEVLPDTFQVKILQRVQKAIDFMDKTFDINTGIINYPMASVYAFYLAGKIFENKSYILRAENLFNECLNYFTPQGLIFGEGNPQNIITKNGCRPIDIAYNLSESLSYLALYLIETKNETALQTIVDSLRSHLFFMLKDGAIDESWCARGFKWTYWGSRTTDAIQNVLYLLAKYDIRFLKAAEANFNLLKNTTHNNLLAGGPDYALVNEPICIHHTFCHAKSFSMLLNNSLSLEKAPDATPLFIETFEGVKHIKEGGVFILNKNGWRATISHYDYIYFSQKNCTPSGGNLTLLWHEAFGPLTAAGLTQNAVPEIMNMQQYTKRSFYSSAPCLEIEGKDNHQVSDAKLYSSLNNEVVAEGVLALSSYKINYQTETKNTFKINIQSQKRGKYIFPLIIKETDSLSVLKNKIILKRGKATLNILFNGALLNKKAVQNKELKFNYTPGFQFIPLEFEVDTTQCIILEVNTLDTL